MILSKDNTLVKYTPIKKDATIVEVNEATNINGVTNNECDFINIQNERPNVTIYYNETALNTRMRKTLPDDAFGIPRLRAYPLCDKSHVQQAIRLFSHCKNENDRKILASNIFAAMRHFIPNSKIRKTNELYLYAPEDLRESATEDKPFIIAGCEKPLNKRSTEDIVLEHIRLNSQYYNNIFYGQDFIKSVEAIGRFSLINSFYPDMCRMSFKARLETVCGGLANGENSKTIYHNLNIREPLSLNFAEPLGDLDLVSVQKDDTLKNLVGYLNYNKDCNWFKVDLSNDIYHTVFCLRLYSIMGKILLSPQFNSNDDLSQEHQNILLDWEQRIQYHYDQYTNTKPNSNKQLQQMQYLWDLFWSFIDNPNDETVITSNRIAMLQSMACASDIVTNINEANNAGELITKEKCSAYLVHELGMPDSIFLLPATMEYPIIDKTSIRLAMDMINRIPEENRHEYSINLNRMYKEYGCTFSISVDHPYANYADKYIIEHMSSVLLEGKTAVDDEGTSVGRSERVTQPWYKRLDHNRGLDINVLDNHELGPNTKEVSDPEYTVHTSIL